MLLKQESTARMRPQRGAGAQEMEKVEKLKKKGGCCHGPWRSWRVAWLPHNPPSIPHPSPDRMQLTGRVGAFGTSDAVAPRDSAQNWGPKGRAVQGPFRTPVSSAMRRQIARLAPIPRPIWSRNHTGTNEARSASHPKCQVRRGPSPFLPCVACVARIACIATPKTWESHAVLAFHSRLRTETEHAGAPRPPLSTAHTDGEPHAAGRPARPSQSASQSSAGSRRAPGPWYNTKLCRRCPDELDPRLITAGKETQPGE